MPISDHFAGMVSERVAECRERIGAASRRGGHGQAITLVAVTKTHGVEAVAAAYQAGVFDVGENRVQEAEEKMKQATALALPVRWHLIGHLQRNKARAAAGFGMVHGMDSERLAVALDDAAGARDGPLDVLLQVNVSGEGTKGGVMPGEVPRLADRLRELRNLRVVGAMTMAPFDAPEPVLRAVFSEARGVRDRLAQSGHPATFLSMGMSGDFEIAVEEGATHVRLGTVLFGTRA